MCEVTERKSVKLNFVSILFGIINSNQKFFEYTEHELTNRALSLEQENLDRYNQLHSIFLLFLLILLLFITVTLTDTGMLLRFNRTHR